LRIELTESLFRQFKPEAAQVGPSGLLKVFHAGLPVAKPQLYLGGR
jgi:hypothetical protein